MARVKIGSILKNKDPKKPDYIQISQDVTLKKGDYLNLENAKSRKESLDVAVADGKVSPEVAEKIYKDIEKMPDFVRFEIVKITKKGE